MEHHSAYKTAQFHVLYLQDCTKSLFEATGVYEAKETVAEIILSLDELAAVLPDERYAPDVSDEDVGELISKFLRSQEEYVRNVFIRKYFYFDSIREIAKRYSFTESKVKNMLFYTRNKLKDYLIKEGVEI